MQMMITWLLLILSQKVNDIHKDPETQAAWWGQYLAIDKVYSRHMFRDFRCSFAISTNGKL